MPKINIDDTIAAIATPIGESGIGIIRISGKDALKVADKIFVSKDKKEPSGFKTYTTHYGWLVDTSTAFKPRPLGRGKIRPLSVNPGTVEWVDSPGALSPEAIVDEVILTVMRAPKSYTKEDIVEINCHGGVAALRRALDLVLANGCRPAEPGEFTKRAFLNGRIDLVQAEAVLDIIKAKTQRGLESALLQLGGQLSNTVKGLRDRLLDIKVHLEAAVDFPDEELPVFSGKELAARLIAIKRDLENLIRSFDGGRIIREGITCVICGKPNVGKSSLMNELLKEERVIVTPFPGTTRDAVCEYINIDGIPMNIVDTAGVSGAAGPVEKEGIIKSRLYIDKADLILFMMDISSGLSGEDKTVIELIKAKEVVCVINKIDLDGRREIKTADLKEYFGREVPVVEVSVLKKMNLEALLENISGAVWKGKVFADDFNIVTNARHKDALLKALSSAGEALSSLEERHTEEIIAISIDEALSFLGEITGESVSGEALNRIFEQFCVGK